MEFNRPPIVKTVEDSQGALVLLVKTIAGTYHTVQRKQLERAIELGGVLTRLKATCRHGEWLPMLEKVGVSRSWASECRRLAKCAPGAHLDDCASVTEARQLLNLQDEEEQEIQEGQQDTQTDAFVTTPPKPDDSKIQKPEHVQLPPECEACLRAQRVGQSLPRSCPDCKSIRQAKKDAEDLQKNSTGGCSLGAIGGYFRKVMIQVGNLAVDHGLSLEQEPEPMKGIRATLHEARAKILSWRDELKTRGEPSNGEATQAGDDSGNRAALDPGN